MDYNLEKSSSVACSGPDGIYPPRTRAQLAQYCRDSGLVMVERQDNQLLLDIDEPLSVSWPHNAELLLDIDEPLSVSWPHNAEAIKRVSIIHNMYRVKRIEQWRSKSSNVHVRIWLHTSFTDAEAITLQMFLGSDPYHEMLSVSNIKKKLTPYSVLFMPKDADVVSTLV